MAPRNKPDRPVRITVRVGQVPFDMLRYDRACPWSEKDSGKLERIACGSAEPDDHVVDFVCFASGAPSPRWASFGCQVLKVEECR